MPTSNKPIPPGENKENRGSRGNRVWAVIPARYASTRFPGKPLKMLAGKPMIQHVYERARDTPSVSRVLVATDDKRIQITVMAFGGEVVMTGDHPSGTDRIAEAVQLESSRGKAPQWVLNVQGDEPTVDPEDLERLIQGMQRRKDGVMGTLMYPLQSRAELEDANIVKVVCDWEGRALYFSRSPIPYPRDEGDLGMRHLGIYLYQADFLQAFHQFKTTPLSMQESLEQLRAMEHGFPIHCFLAHSLGIGVDIPSDLAKAEAMLKHKP